MCAVITRLTLSAGMLTCIRDHSTSVISSRLLGGSISHHSNTDSDEVLFYSDGDFMNRKGSGVGAGSITFHPVGFTHGPQPGSLEASLDKIKTDELAYPFSWNR